MKASAKDIQTAAYGCLAGALVGDAAGAILEFIGRKPIRDKVHQIRALYLSSYHAVVT